MEAATVVLDRDDMRRTLVRIAHEIVEKNPDGTIAIVGIHRRGAHLAERLHALTSELLEPAVPLGSVDISFYRDDLAIRPSAPVVHATAARLPGRRADDRDRRRRALHRAAPSARRSTRSSTSAARPGSSSPSLVDRGHRELPIRPDYVGKNIPTSQDQRVNVRVEEVDGLRRGHDRPGRRKTRIKAA